MFCFISSNSPRHCAFAVRSCRVGFGIGVLAILLSAATVASAEPTVWITPLLKSVDVIHEGRRVTIKRDPDTENTVNLRYAFTSRPCPPFCIQPMNAAPGVETVGEVEVLAYLEQIAEGDDSVIVIDARTAQWPRRGMIPGAVNIPWTRFDATQGSADAQAEVLEKDFGARRHNGVWDFSAAKTLVLYCNGMWCSQSTIAVDALLTVGYPADKLKWYRGGMQNWENLGLTVVKSSR